MRRRAFLSGSAALLTAPRPVAAQQAAKSATVGILSQAAVAHAQPAGKVPRVGYLSPFSASNPQIQHSRDIFLLALRELGYVEGQDVAVEYRWAEGKNEQLPRLAAELVHGKVDVIVATGVCHRLELHSKRRG